MSVFIKKNKSFNVLLELSECVYSINSFLSLKKIRVECMSEGNGLQFFENSYYFQ